MSNIKAPFNFVPLHKKVVSPYWVEQISHDIPFEKSESGELNITLHAHSPIFVKNGMGKEEEQQYYNEKGDTQVSPYPFNNFENKYFIPGSSLKGMIRSVLEIMSFGRMENKVNDTRYSVRDFHNNEIYDKSNISNKVQCGWLKKENGKYFIQECGKPIRISHKAIDDKFKTKMVEFFASKDNLKNKRTKAAQFKYDKFTKVTYKGKFKKYQNASGRERSVFDSEGFDGTLVFTGQPGHRYFNKEKDKWEGKFFEFVFPDKKNNFEEIKNEDLIKNFFFAYYDHDITNQKDDWKWRKPQLEKGETIPIFFRKEKGRIKDMGLSMLYKITYNNSVKESIQNRQNGTNLDLSEAIFGYVDDENNEALKGRVHIGHAFTENGTRIRPTKVVLASPKASYYPFYVEQNINNGRVHRYNTFMDKSAVVAGWKRYPIHVSKPRENQRIENQKIATQFTPLDSGTEFQFKIRYHNLKKIEIGALLSALTFHQTEGTFHSLGMAKPLGYGKVTLEVGGLKNMNEYLAAFESYMNIELGNSLPEWGASPQITELITMVSEQRNQGNSELAYMKLTQFVDAKNKDKPQRGSGLDALDRYSNLVNNPKMIKTTCTPEDIEKMKRFIQKEKETLQKLRLTKNIIADDKAKKKQELILLFEAKKKEIIEALDSKRKEIRLKEIEKREKAEAEKRAEVKGNKKAIAEKEGIKLEHIKNKDRNAFDLLKKAVEKFSREIHTKNDKQLLAEFPEGFLPEMAHDAVFNKLKEIFILLRSKDKKKWLESNNSPSLKKIVSWIGAEKTKQWFDELKSL
jgi:CRISPR-associated protein (TIGR03986 family)